MENYAHILETLENNFKQAQEARDTMEREKERALHEVRMVR